MPLWNKVDFEPYAGFANYIGNAVFGTIISIRNQTILVVTGNRFGKCVTYSTLIDTINGPVSIGKLYREGKSFCVYAWDGKRKVITEALPPFKKSGIHRCYRIEMSDGRWIEAADHHFILTDHGYVSVEEIVKSFFLSQASKVNDGPYFSSPGRTSLEFSPSVQILNDLRLSEKVLDFRGNYFSDFHLYGEPLRILKDIFQFSFPLQDDAQKHIHPYFYWGDSGNIYANIRRLVHDRLSTLYVYRRFAGRFSGSLSVVLNTIFQLSLYGILISRKLLFGLIFYFRSYHAIDLHIRNKRLENLSCHSPLYVDGNRIISVKSIPSQEVYDFTVPKYHNYFAGGLIHHNTKAWTRRIVYSVMGMCKHQDHNILPEDNCRVIRLASQTLPNDKDNEVHNTIYPLLKEQLPPDRIVKDIVSRNATMTVQPLLGGLPAQLEYVSYGQPPQSQAGQARKAILVDEVCPYAFYEESLPRLATTYGQMLMGTTPVEAAWMFTEIYERARVYYRTPIVRAFMKKEMGEDVPTKLVTDSKQDIAVIQAASDDNPIFVKMVQDFHDKIKAGIIKPEDFPYANVSEYLDSIFMYDDKDTVAMRRYGIFKQVTGAVHKEFNWNIHMISEGKYFPTGIPANVKHARMIDYHQSTPWAINWIFITLDDEAFVYRELTPDPHIMTTDMICKEVALISRDFHFSINLIDPLASENQVKTNTSVVQDMNTEFIRMKKEKLGTGGYWETWDTKGTKGEDKVRERFINAKICGRPFNNLQMIDGRMVRLPTLWIFDCCRTTGLSLKNWQMKQRIGRNAQVTKDPPDDTEQRWSHHNMTLEAIFKDSRFRGAPHIYQSKRDEFTESRYFHGRRRT